MSQQSFYISIKGTLYKKVKQNHNIQSVVCITDINKTVGII